MLPVPCALRAMETTGKFRAWCLTIWSDDELSALRAAPGLVACCVGEEVCPTTARKHYQSYARFKQPKTFVAIKKICPTAHIEVRHKSEAEASEYCRKDGKVLVDFGCETTTGRSGDAAETAMDMIEDGAPLWQLYKANRRFFFYNYPKIRDLYKVLQTFREEGVDPKRYKRDDIDPDVKPDV